MHPIQQPIKTHAPIVQSQIVRIEDTFHRDVQERINQAEPVSLDNAATVKQRIASEVSGDGQPQRDPGQPIDPSPCITI
jgi:hypothetical protein